MLRPARSAATLLLAAGAASVFAQPATQPAPASDADARIAFYQARIGGPGTYPAYARLGAAYLQKARETGRASYLDQAERYLQRSLDLLRNQEALRWLAAVQLEQHRFRQALSHAQEAVAAWPADLEAQGVLFDVHLALGELDQATAVAERILAGAPSFASLTRKAALQSVRGDPTGAAEAMAQACADAEARSLPAETRAWCQVRLGAYQVASCQGAAAERAYNRAIEVFPGYCQAIEHLAELRAAQQRTAEAIALYNQLLSEHPNPGYRLALAEQLESIERGGAEAERALAQALDELRRSAAQGSLSELRALALLLLEDDQTVAEGLRWAQTDWDNRGDALAADTLAWAYYKSGRLSEAKALIERAMRAGGTEPLVLLHAAYIHRRLGDFSQARELLERALACPLQLSPAARAAAEALRAELERP